MINDKLKLYCTSLKLGAGDKKILHPETNLLHNFFRMRRLKPRPGKERIWQSWKDDDIGDKGLWAHAGKIVLPLQGKEYGGMWLSPGQGPELTKLVPSGQPDRTYYTIIGLWVWRERSGLCETCVHIMHGRYC